GTCVEDHTVNRPSDVDGCATTPRGSIGTPATRGKSSTASTTTSASASPRATSPTPLFATPAMLSGQSSKTRGAAGDLAASMLAAAARGSQVTRTASAPSVAWYASSATTTATASPTWRASVLASAW